MPQQESKARHLSENILMAIFTGALALLGGYFGAKWETSKNLNTHLQEYAYQVIGNDQLSRDEKLLLLYLQMPIRDVADGNISTEEYQARLLDRFNNTFLYTGVVRDANTNTPIAGARIRIKADNFSPFGTLTECYTGDNGYFTCEKILFDTIPKNLTALNLVIDVSHPEYIPTKRSKEHKITDREFSMDYIMKKKS